MSGIKHLGLATDDDAPAADGAWQDERTPPHDLQAEQGALGGALLTRDAAEDVLESVQPADFYIPKHEVILESIQRQFEHGQPTDVIAVTDELTKSKMLQRAGGAEYLHTLTGLVPTAANAGYYASIVAEKAVLRRLVEAGTRIVQMGYASEGEIPMLVENARAEVDAVSTRRKHELRRISDGMDDLIEELAAQPTFQLSPWDALNQRIGGFAPGELWVFGARPGNGKSLALFQVAMKAAKAGTVAYVSVEMKFRELQKRMISSYGEVHMTAMREHSLSNSDWMRFKDGMRLTEGAPVYVDDIGAGSAYTVADVRAHARAVQKRGGTTPLAMIVVDYIQLLTGRGENRNLEIASISRGLKMLAGEFNVPVVVAAQLNRAQRGVRGSTPPPKLDALRESGSLEQDADGVVMLHRDEKRPGEIDFIEAKHRSGASGGSTAMRWQPHYARILDPIWREPLWSENRKDLA